MRINEQTLRAVLAVLLAGVFAGLYWRAAALPPAGGFAIELPGDAKPRGAARAVRLDVSAEAVASVHAASAVELGDGGLRAFWYGGSREGAGDVAIYSATLAPDAGGWGGEERVLDRATAQRALGRYVRKLGNAVPLRDARGRLWLFFVSVSVGGWSGSAINVAISDDEGRTWGPARRLVTSPFLNISTLVKGAPFLYADGTIGLPVYHESLGKFGELLRLDENARVIGKTRLTSGRYSLQPRIVPLSLNEAVAVLRYAGDPPARILFQTTSDGGARWSEPAKLALPNPNAAVDALRIGHDELLLAFNNCDNCRSDLSLARSRDQGRTWQVLRAVEHAQTVAGEREREYSYPWLLATRDGDLHLFYTHERSRIRHLRFNRAWLESEQ